MEREKQIFRLHVRCDSDALIDSDTEGSELARILREVADRVVSGAPRHYQTILDVNGNDVGRYALKPESCK